MKNFSFTPISGFDYSGYKTIRHGGEKIIFIRDAGSTNGQFVEVHNELTPGSGPPMHVHFLQDEMLEVMEGELSAEYKDGRKLTLKPGESIQFNRGEAHRFWNSGSGTLRCRGWVAPAYNFEWFITENYRILSAAKGGRPDGFDMAFLMNRFKTEFDVLELPPFVRNVLMPVFYTLGKMTGKYKKYKDAPVGVRE